MVVQTTGYVRNRHGALVNTLPEYEEETLVKTRYAIIWRPEATGHNCGSQGITTLHGEEKIVRKNIEGRCSTCQTETLFQQELFQHQKIIDSCPQTAAKSDKLDPSG